jgi:hypothetical protein
MVLNIGHNYLSVLAVSRIDLDTIIERRPVNVRRFFGLKESATKKKVILHKIGIMYYDEHFLLKEIAYSNQDRDTLESIAKDIQESGAMIGSEQFMSRPDYGNLLNEIEKRNNYENERKETF